jgi:uncharacterized protein with PIN domain
MSLPPLKVVLGADTAGLEAGLNSALGSLKKFAGAAGIGLVVRGLKNMVLETMATIDAQAKLARAVGGTTAGLQALARAADRSGVQSSELAAAATRLNQKLGEVIATGKGADDTFKKLGISARDLAAMDVDQRFMAISDAMRAAGLSSQEMSYHLRELGIRQSSVITLIQGGSEEIARSRKALQDFGVTISEIDAAQIERANDALSEVGRVAEGLRNQLAVEFAPAIELMANAFTSAAMEGGAVHTIVQGLVVLIPRLATYFGTAAAAATIYTAGLVAMKVATLGAAAAAVGLRTALLRLGLPALVILAGELVYRFIDLAEKAGGFGAALEALGDVAKAAFEYMIAQGRAVPPALRAVWNDMKASFVGAIAEMQWRWSEFLGSLALGMREIPFIGDAVADRLAENARGAAASWEAMSAAADSYRAAAGAARDEADAIKSEGAAGLAEAMQRLRDLMAGGGEGETKPGAPGDPESAPAIAPGVGGAGKVADEMAKRLEAVRQGLLSETELVSEWYQESLETLNDALEQKRITEEEYMALRERLEQEHQDRLNAIRDKASQYELQARKDTQNAAIGLLGQLGQKSRAAAIAALALQAAQRVSEITASTAAAQVRALAELGPIAGPPAAAKIGAFGMAQKAIAVASAALNAGGGGRGGASADLSGGGASAAAAMPTQEIRVNLMNATDQQKMGFQEFINTFNNAVDAGYRPRGMVI